MIKVEQSGKKNIYLNSEHTEPLTRLLITENGQQKVLTDGAEIQEAIIDHNIQYFSAVEDTPLGKGIFLYNAIGPHVTSKFCDRVLNWGRGEAYREDINYVEAYELLQHMQRKKQVEKRTPGEWITDTLKDLLTLTQAPNDTDSDSDTNEEPEELDPEAPWDDLPDQKPEIGLKRTRE